MSERINTPYTSEHFVAFCLSMLGQPYWYGTVVYKCSESPAKPKGQAVSVPLQGLALPAISRTLRIRRSALTALASSKGYNWTSGGVGVREAIGTDKTFSSKYGGNGCPDKSANGMFTYAKSKGCAWGTIDTLEIPGVALRSDGHVGVYVGDGCAVEERVFRWLCEDQGVLRKWTHWFQLPFVDYGDAVFTGGSYVKPDTAETVYTLGTRTLKNGSKGTDVKAMQEFLLQLEYNLPKYGTDGEFGSETEKALKKFQKKVGIKQDGIYGSETHTALMDAVADG